MDQSQLYLFFVCSAKYVVFSVLQNFRTEVTCVGGEGGWKRAALGVPVCLMFVLALGHGSSVPTVTEAWEPAPLEITRGGKEHSNSAEFTR